jgi:hypothetical protein
MANDSPLSVWILGDMMYLYVDPIEQEGDIRARFSELKVWRSNVEIAISMCSDLPA